MADLAHELADRFASIEGVYRELGDLQGHASDIKEAVSGAYPLVFDGDADADTKTGRAKELSGVFTKLEGTLRELDATETSLTEEQEVVDRLYGELMNVPVPETPRQPHLRRVPSRTSSAGEEILTERDLAIRTLMLGGMETGVDVSAGLRETYGIKMDARGMGAYVRKGLVQRRDGQIGVYEWIGPRGGREPTRRSGGTQSTFELSDEYQAIRDIMGSEEMLLADVSTELNQRGYSRDPRGFNGLVKNGLIESTGNLVGGKKVYRWKGGSEKETKITPRLPPLKETENPSSRKPRQRTKKQLGEDDLSYLDRKVREILHELGAIPYVELSAELETRYGTKRDPRGLAGSLGNRGLTKKGDDGVEWTGPKYPGKIDVDDSSSDDLSPPGGDARTESKSSGDAEITEGDRRLADALENSCDQCGPGHEFQLKGRLDASLIQYLESIKGYDVMAKILELTELVDPGSDDALPDRATRSYLQKQEVASGNGESPLTLGLVKAATRFQRDHGKSQNVEEHIRSSFRVIGDAKEVTIETATATRITEMTLMAEEIDREHLPDDIGATVSITPIDPVIVDDIMTASPESVVETLIGSDGYILETFEGGEEGKRTTAIIENDGRELTIKAQIGTYDHEDVTDVVTNSYRTGLFSKGDKSMAEEIRQMIETVSE